MNYRLLVLALILLILVFVRFTPLSDKLTLEQIKQNRAFLQEYVQDNYLIAVFVFVLVYIMVAGLSIPGAAVLTTASGFFFGAIQGTVYTNIGATTGALVVFLLTRYLIGDWAQDKYHRVLQKINKEIKVHGTSYFLTLRFIPLFPFWAVNLAGGLSKIKTRTFIWTTMLGIIPGSFAYAFAGKQLAAINSVSEVLNPDILFAFILLGALALFPVIYNKIIKKKIPQNI